MIRVIIILLVVISCGCVPEPDYPDDVSDDVSYDKDDNYLTYAQYRTLLNELDGVVIKNTITNKLSDMGVSPDYEYSYYESGSYKCYSFNWNSWSGGWVYYIDVDIWTKDGTLNVSMCSYYSD